MWVNIHHTWMVWVVCNLQLLRLASFGFPGSARTRLGCDFGPGLLLGKAGLPSQMLVVHQPTKKIPCKSSLQGFIPRNHARTSNDFPRNTLDGFQIRLEAVQLGGVVPFIGFLDVKVLSSVSWENGGFNLGFLEMPEMLRHKCLHPDGMPGFLGATCIPYIHKWNIMSTKN